MAGSDKQKQSLYFPEETLAEIMRESIRLDRSLSWTVQQAWRLAREEVKKFPSVTWRDDVSRPRPVAAAPTPPPLRERAPAPVQRRAEEPVGEEVSAQVREFLRNKFDREVMG
jgi:uncharacterized small protein (TIGR04563 family)